MVARHLGVVEAVGSSPVTQTIKKTVDFSTVFYFYVGQYLCEQCAQFLEIYEL